MKKLILGLLLLTSTSAFAETVFVNIPIKTTHLRRYACYPFYVQFPGWTCYAKSCGNYSRPRIIKGTACGIHVYCVNVGGIRYRCHY